ncbi:heavy-metal-associated domain-containing protein [Streptomyces rhizosphaericola]|uniref:heavy-metal-associated domain-containing protein n=1 Tax=Streptomyces rhizosphaericola TaxID=2564098 RepID=UPI0036772D65
MDEKRYRVTGMTCGHCVAGVMEQVSGVPGVEEMRVDLLGGTVLVRGRALDDTAVRTAVVEAGYAVAEPLPV